MGCQASQRSLKGVQLMDVDTEPAAVNAEVDVRFTPAGAPSGVRYDGRIWSVAADPFHWFDRNDWWKSGQPAPRGGGVDLVSVEYWRVQVRLTSTSTLRTFTLRRDPRAPAWVLESISDEGSVAA